MGAIIASLAVVLLWALTIYGYAHNVILLIYHTGVFGIMEVVRIVGIFVPPVGVLMGFIS